jgi:hypothetical protein
MISGPGQPALSLIVLMSLGLAGCAGSLARVVADASNRPGGLFAVVPCRHDPDSAGQLRTTVTRSATRGWELVER